MPLPTLFERARDQSARRPSEPLDLESLEGLRRAVGELVEDQVTLLAKVLADGRVDEGERRVLEDAEARLARYYEVALGFDPASALAPAHRAVLDVLEHQAAALAAAAAGDREGANEAGDRARMRLREIDPGAPAHADPRRIHDAAERVYDRATGRSKYDPQEEGWLAFRLRCPRDTCGHLGAYRLLVGHSTHKVVCPACTGGFTVYVATVASSERHVGQGVIGHEVRTRDADGTERVLRFEEATQPPGIPLSHRDLLVVTYDEDNRLRLVRNYSRGHEAWVAPRSRCFIATAALGPFAPELALLRRYRDERLIPVWWGRALVRAYEWASPPLARGLARRPALRRPVGGLVRALARRLG